MSLLRRAWTVSSLRPAPSVMHGLNVCFLGDEAGSGLTIWHLEGVDGLEGGLNAGVLKVGASVENVIADG